MEVFGMLSLANTITRTIPISQFNRGLAGQIFNDVKKNGAKIVIKNNIPEAVILSTDEYIKNQQEIEDLKLLLLAKERFENTSPQEYVSSETVDEMFGFNEDDLKDANEVELE